MLCKLLNHTRSNLFTSIPRKAFSIKSSFGRLSAAKRPDEKNSTEERKYKELEAFEQIMSFFQEREKYTWDDLLVQVRTNYEKNRDIISMIRSRQDPAREELNNLNKFVSCLFEDEKKNRKFSKKDIENISKLTGLSEEAITGFIELFYNYSITHETLKRVKEKGLPLPKNQEELEELIKKFSRSIIEDENDLRKQEIHKKIKAKLGYSKSMIEKKEREAGIKYMRTRKPTYQF